jgi:hypothetical protein
VLTQSFNRMTRQLDARRDTERHRAELESARGYLESILANLSTGVLVFDRRFVLRTANEGALTILNDDFDGVVSVARTNGRASRCSAPSFANSSRPPGITSGRPSWILDRRRRHASGCCSTAPAGDQWRRRRGGVR